jgi:hypothetical protein
VGKGVGMEGGDEGMGMRGWGRWVGKEVGMVGGDEGMGKVGG